VGGSSPNHYERSITKGQELKSSWLLTLVVGFYDSIQCAEFILLVGLVKASQGNWKGTACGIEYVNAVRVFGQPFRYSGVDQIFRRIVSRIFVTKIPIEALGESVEHLRERPGIVSSGR